MNVVNNFEKYSGKDILKMSNFTIEFTKAK